MASRIAPGGNSTLSLGAGPDVLAERPSTAVRCAPGGASTIALGAVPTVDEPLQNVSSNAFARGSNQNCGNVLTERPSTAVRCAPGGATSIILGGEESCDVIFGSDMGLHVQSSGRPAPGGPCSIILGGDSVGATAVLDDVVARPLVGGVTSISL